MINVIIVIIKVVIILGVSPCKSLLIACIFKLLMTVVCRISILIYRIIFMIIICKCTPQVFVYKELEFIRLFPFVVFTYDVYLFVFVFLCQVRLVG